MSILDTYIVSETESEQRLSDVAFLAFEKIVPSRKGIKKAIKRGCLLVNGDVGASGWKMKTGQRIDLLEDYAKIPKIYELELEVLYEDEQVAVVLKPAGLIVSGNEFRTIYNALGYNIQKSTMLDALPYPTPCHRLDKATAGCLLIAKTKGAQIALGNQFAERTIKKEYLAIVHGDLPHQGLIETPINGQAAKSTFEKVKRVQSSSGEFFSLVKMFPHTGRTHQLRIHFSGLAHPILGDKLYGEKGNVFLHKGLFLCSVGVSFCVGEEHKEVRIDTPRKFTRVLGLFQKGD